MVTGDVKFWRELVVGLKAEGVRLGLGPVMVTSPEVRRVREYEAWVEKGMHGEMGYLAREDRLDRRRDLGVVLPGVKAVVVCGLVYWPGRAGFEEETAGKETTEGEVRGKMSCYAWGKDYHKVFGDRLEALARWIHERAGGVGRWYVDTGAIMERDLAEQAGMGFIGKNTMLIHPRYGSGLFLGEVLTTLPLVPPAVLKEESTTTAKATTTTTTTTTARRRKLAAGGPRMPSCGKCRRCQDACPTDAFKSEYVLDARKCISYLTIELKGEIPVDLRPKMGTRVYGCDICQEVCPWNKFDWEGDLRGHSPLYGRVGKDVKVAHLHLPSSTFPPS